MYLLMHNKTNNAILLSMPECVCVRACVYMLSLVSHPLSHSLSFSAYLFDVFFVFSFDLSDLLSAFRPLFSECLSYLCLFMCCIKIIQFESSRFCIHESFSQRIALHSVRLWLQVRRSRVTNNKKYEKKNND